MDPPYSLSDFDLVVADSEPPAQLAVESLALAHLLLEVVMVAVVVAVLETHRSRLEAEVVQLVAGAEVAESGMVPPHFEYCLEVEHQNFDYYFLEAVIEALQ